MPKVFDDAFFLDRKSWSRYFFIDKNLTNKKGGSDAKAETCDLFRQLCCVKPFANLPSAGKLFSEQEDRQIK